MVDIRHFQEKAQMQLPYLGVAENRSSDSFLFFNNLRNSIDNAFSQDDEAPYIDVYIERYEKDPNDILLNIEIHNKSDFFKDDNVSGHIVMGFKKAENCITVSRITSDENGKPSHFDKDNYTYSVEDIYYANNLAKNIILEQIPEKYRKAVSKLIDSEFRKLNDRDIIDTPVGVQL